MDSTIPAWQTSVHELAPKWSSFWGADRIQIVNYFDQHSLDPIHLSWLDHFAEFIVAKNWEADVNDVRGFLNGQAWRDRGRSNGLDWTDDFLDLSVSKFADRCRIYYLGTRLRYDFRFQKLDEASGAWLRNSKRDDPNEEPDALLLAFRAFSLVEAKPEDGLRFLDRALASPNANSNTRLICLQALWIARSIPRQAERMLEVAQLMRDDGQPLGSVANYWISRAYRLRGEWDKAYECIDRAFETLEPGSDFISIHQDFAREREQITAAVLLNEQLESNSLILNNQIHDFRVEMKNSLEQGLTSAIDQLKSETQRAEERIAESILNIVTIIGVFVAIMGFLAASGVLVFKSKFPWWQDAILLASAGLVTVGFFIVLRLIVAGGIKRAKKS